MARIGVARIAPPPPRHRRGRAVAPGLLEGLIDHGDSGGPAFVFENGQLQLAAIANFGDDFCVPDQRLDAATGDFDPRADPGCLALGAPDGYIAVGGIFGTTSEHLLVGRSSQLGFVTQTPEPGTLALLGAGLGALGAAARRRARAARA